MTSPIPIASRKEAPGDDEEEARANDTYDAYDTYDTYDTYDMRDFETYAAVRWPRLLRTAYLLTNGDHHEAEDLVQVTLAKIYLRWHHIRTLDAPDQYVRRALINNNTTRQRKRRVVQLLTPHLPEQRCPSASENNYETRSELFDALATLPPRQRAIVVLRYWECLSEQQTADLLGCSVGTVKSQASRALKKLRSSAALSDYAGTTARTARTAQEEPRT